MEHKKSIFKVDNFSNNKKQGEGVISENFEGQKILFIYPWVNGQMSLKALTDPKSIQKKSLVKTSQLM